MELTLTDVEHLLPLLQNAVAEVDVYVEGESAISPDDPIKLANSLSWGQEFLLRLEDAGIKGELPEATKDIYYLISRAERDDVQRLLTDWERDFLNSMLENRDRSYRMKSIKILGVLEKIVGKAYGRSQAR